MRCVSDVGTYDMVGNVWEWVEGIAEKGVWDGRPLPATGYVNGVDVYGMPLTTGSAVDERFNSDRFWSDVAHDTALMRGGYYQSGSNAGIYTVYAASPATFYGDAVGFRCATTLEYEK
jgi:formylglycine-generating enzyme required for sulfatase activity